MYQSLGARESTCPATHSGGDLDDSTTYAESSRIGGRTVGRYHRRSHGAGLEAGFSRHVPPLSERDPLADVTSGQPRVLAINGATGRMGTRILQLMADDPAVTLGAAIEHDAHRGLGQDVGPLVGLGAQGVCLVSRLDRAVDAVIDFSTPAGTLAMARACRERGVPLVVGTTGLGPDQRAELDRAAEEVPLLVASNFSKAVNLLFKLAAIAAKSLGDAADIEIVERHHHFKKDAPSGTAWTLARTVAEAIGSDQFTHGREGLVGERPRGEIGLHALRTGDNPGEHTVVFGLMGESLELSHRALNRDGFARGAIDAAKWLIGKPRGRYSMSDLLGS